MGVGGNYPQGIARLMASHAAVGCTVSMRCWTDWPEGCPKHSEIPYGFKPWAMARAASAQGAVLWLDAACWLRADPAPVFDRLAGAGYMLPDACDNLGRWTADSALDRLEISRREAFSVPMVAATAIGLDLRHVIARKFLGWWLALSLDGVTFAGIGGSAYPGVLGHRHDQSAASAVAYQLGMGPTEWPAEIGRSKNFGANWP